MERMSKKEKSCLNCRIFWDREGCCEVCRWEDKDHPSLFYQITRSPEALAEKVVYLDGIAFTSPFIDDSYIVGKEKGESWEERYFKARDKAIAATVDELNKVVGHE